MVTTGETPVTTSDQKQRDPLSLAESYIIAQSFLNHIKAAPSRVDEPVDGVVELEGAGTFSRVKYDRVPLTQGAVLALLRAAGDSGNNLVLFSPSGFTHAALSVAEAHYVALFQVHPDGSVEPITSAARLAVPAEPFLSPLATTGWESADPTEQPGEDATSEAGNEDQPKVTGSQRWRDCPRCGTSHHRDARTCASCGTDLRKRLSKLGAKAKKTSADAAALGGATLRCRSCGSRDIEVVSGS
jgi:ribosomal protein L37E